jgi:membrane protease YdiL (CAAX protease family)
MSRDDLSLLAILLVFLVAVDLPLNPFVPGLLQKSPVAYVLLPAAALLLLGRNPLACGLGPGDWRKGLRWTVLLAAVVVAGCYLLSRTESFQFYYHTGRWGTGSARIILGAEWRRAVHLAGWEFLFRGVLLFGLAGLLGPAAGNAVQAALCALMHIQKPVLEFYGSFPFALVLGAVALRTRSIWYGLILHWLLGFSLEAFVALKQGIL